MKKTKRRIQDRKTKTKTKQKNVKSLKPRRKALRKREMCPLAAGWWNGDELRP
jgi:hypothetical protein